ncbi:hypothetical protein [Streptomyces sp. IGB124]|uniref:hypothetical protein n=1 Tax=Streptomyces sp. IGB124 TaxID=1519485 RepID=UPI000AC274F9|nr:hypothetical protein [Streptomyces sp. IGB124]
MTDSGRSQDRDDDVPDPHSQSDPLAKPGPNGDDPDSEGPSEPEGVTSSRWSWIARAVDVLQLVNQILDLLNGNGG